MSIPPISWSHPPSRAIAKGRLIGRGRYHLRRQQMARARREQVAARLDTLGWDTSGACAIIAQELGCHRCTVTRDRQYLLRTLGLGDPWWHDLDVPPI